MVKPPWATFVPLITRSPIEKVMLKEIIPSTS